MEKDSRSLAEVITHCYSRANDTFINRRKLTCLCHFLPNRRLRTLTSFYVRTLAAADMMFGTFSSSFQSIASGLGRWSLNDNFCQFTGFVAQFWAQLSLCILALFLINRYFCAVKPNRYSIFSTRKKTLCSIVLIWIGLFLQTLIYIFATPIIFRWPPNILYCRGTIRDRRGKNFLCFFGCLYFSTDICRILLCQHLLRR